MRMNKVVSVFLSAIMLIMIFASYPAISAECASGGGFVELKANKIYTSYDVNGDGRKDRFKLQMSQRQVYPYYKKLEISVNGKTAYTFTARQEFLCQSVNLISLSNGKKFLFIDTSGNDVPGPLKAVLQYKNGKYVKIVDFNQLLKKHGDWQSVSVSSVNGTAVNFDISMLSWAVGLSNYSIQYVYKDSTLKQNISAAMLTGVSVWKNNHILYVNKKIHVYTNTATNKIAFDLKYNDKVIISKCRIASTRMLLKVRCGNRYGWIIAASRRPQKRSEMQFQGVELGPYAPYQ